MFIRALLPVVALAAAVAAAPGGSSSSSSSECDTGSNNCCQTVQDSSSTVVSELAGLLGINLSGITGNVGLGCTSIVGGDSCTQQPVCCNGDSFSGLIVIGCSPINIL